jgi:hypothetical protein
MVARSGTYIAQMSSNPSTLECVDFARHSAFIVEQGETFMKMMRLCFLLLFSVCLAGVSYGQDAANQDSAKAKGPRQGPDLLAGQVAPGTTDRLIYNLKPDLFMPDAAPNSVGSSCAYLRTYRVKRQTPGSDAVAPAGYTTCVPTRRFEVRSAVQTQTDSGTRK